MGKILAVVIGLGVLGAIAYKVMYGSARVVTADEKSAPAQQLDNVRGAAKRIEGDTQKAADAVQKQAFGNE